MTEQLQLVDVAAPARKLTANQRLAHDYITAHDGVTVDEIGAYVHAHRETRPHGVDVRCDWCAQTGMGLVKSKALAPLLTYRRAPGGHLYLLRDKPSTTQSSQLDVLPGETFEDIFGMPAPTDDADTDISRSNTPDETP